jgi:hypothetical protein
MRTPCRLYGGEQVFGFTAVVEEQDFQRNHLLKKKNRETPVFDRKLSHCGF